MPNIELVHQAKARIAEIVSESKKILEYHYLIIHDSPLGIEITQIWDGWLTYIDCINFGSHELTQKQVRRIIEEEEYLNFKK